MTFRASYDEQRKWDDTIAHLSRTVAAIHRPWYITDDGTIQHKAWVALWDARLSTPIFWRTVQLHNARKREENRG